VIGRAIGLWWLNACPIVYIVDEVGPISKFGFAYGTLPGHVESGEERFLIVWNRGDNTVWFDIVAFSHPNHFLTRFVYPVVRRLQKQFGRDSAASMLKAVRLGEDSSRFQFCARLVIAKRKTGLRDVLIAICSVFKSGQVDLNRVGARPLALQFPHWSVRNGCLLARVGPTHRSRLLRAIRPKRAMSGCCLRWPHPSTRREWRMDLETSHRFRPTIPGAAYSVGVHRSGQSRASVPEHPTIVRQGSYNCR
jgi:Domain of unknown function (DUF1990)